MQATRTLGGPGISKSGVSVVVAIAAAFALGAGGGYAARSVGHAAPATHVAGAVTTLHQQAPDAADRNAGLGLRAGGPGGQIGDVPAGYDPNEYVSAPIRAVVPAVNPAAGYDVSQFVAGSAGNDTSQFVSGNDFCEAINRHKAC
jgi:hypothetical protein